MSREHQRSHRADKDHTKEDTEDERESNCRAGSSRFRNWGRFDILWHSERLSPGGEPASKPKCTFLGGGVATNLPLHHVNLGAILMELHLVHQLINQEDSATMIRVEILSHSATGNRTEIKARPGIAHDDEDAALLVTRHQIGR